MESFFSRFKNALVLIAILLAQTIALATQVRRPGDPAGPDGRQVRLVRLWALALITPAERLSTGGGHGLRSAWSNYVSLRHVREQNNDLTREVARLRLERAALAEDALEGQRLQKLLAFRQRYVATTVVAEVIGTSGSEQGHLLTLNKGAHDGLEPGMAVITPDGVVGKLRDVFPGTSQLLLLSDPTLGAGVLFASTRIRAVVHGSPQGRLEITNLTADERLRPGEAVLTSGGDQVFPRGLPVGTLESIAPDPEHQPYNMMFLRPAADLNRLDEVLVITRLGAALDAGAQAELAREAAAHPLGADAPAADVPATDVRGADVRAERLPSLHDAGNPGTTASDTGTNASAPPPENARGLVPRPKPVLAPDRYSPGAAPPADQLKPGAPRPQ